MAAGDSFTLNPTVVIPVAPEYHNIITPSESMKKEFINIAATPLEQWKLVFAVLSSTNMNVALTHYKDNSGGYYQFIWTSVPSYINSGSDITGHWIDGSLNIAPNGKKHWSVDIIFEKLNT